MNEIVIKCRRMLDVMINMLEEVEVKDNQVRAMLIILRTAHGCTLSEVFMADFIIYLVPFLAKWEAVRARLDKHGGEA